MSVILLYILMAYKPTVRQGGEVCNVDKDVCIAGMRCISDEEEEEEEEEEEVEKEDGDENDEEDDEEDGENGVDGSDLSVNNLKNNLKFIKSGDEFNGRKNMEMIQRNNNETEEKNDVDFNKQKNGNFNVKVKVNDEIKHDKTFNESIGDRTNNSGNFQTIQTININSIRDTIISNKLKHKTIEKSSNTIYSTPSKKHQRLNKATKPKSTQTLSNNKLEKNRTCRCGKDLRMEGGLCRSDMQRILGQSCDPKLHTCLRRSGKNGRLLGSFAVCTCG